MWKNKLGKIARVGNKDKWTSQCKIFSLYSDAFLKWLMWVALVSFLVFVNDSVLLCPSDSTFCPYGWFFLLPLNPGILHCSAPCLLFHTLRITSSICIWFTVIHIHISFRLQIRECTIPLPQIVRFQSLAWKNYFQ